MDTWHQFFLFMHAMATVIDSTKTKMTLIVPGRSLWRWGVPFLSVMGLIVLLVLGGNVGLFYLMNRITSSAEDAIWIHLSLIADGQMIVLLVLPFFGRRPDMVWQYVLAAILAGIFVPGMKELFSTLRPPASLVEGSFHLIGPALQVNAFPSGHTTAMFIFAGLVCLQRVHTWLKISMVLLAVSVGLSRIASGVHWPMDTLGAAIVGWLIANLAVWLSYQWQVGLNIWVQRAFALLLTPFSVWAVWSLWQNHDDVYPGTGVMKVFLLITCLALSLPGQLQLFNIKKL